MKGNKESYVLVCLYGESYGYVELEEELSKVQFV